MNEGDQCPFCYRKIMVTAKKAADDFVKKNSKVFFIDGFLWGSIATLCLIVSLILVIGLLSCAVVYFRGDYVDCKEMENFIHRMKNPHITNKKVVDDYF